MTAGAIPVIGVVGGIELTGEPAFIRSNMVHGFKQMPVRLLPR